MKPSLLLLFVFAAHFGAHAQHRPLRIEEVQERLLPEFAPLATTIPLKLRPKLLALKQRYSKD